MLLKQMETCGRVTLTLNRPEARNALNGELMDALLDALGKLAERQDLRVLVLWGEGSVFCAGADLGGMRTAGAGGTDPNRADAERLAELFHAWASFPAPTVAAVQGAAFGGALGLVACSDLVVAQGEARFALPEVRVGLVPATISPYVVRRLGVARATDLMLTGRRILASEALNVGLVHRVVGDLEQGLADVLSELSLGGPESLRGTKALLLAASPLPDEGARRRTVEALVAHRATAEAQEGTAAFLEKRSPSWVMP